MKFVRGAIDLCAGNRVCRRREASSSLGERKKVIN